jgi:2-methylcitrate dehydratase PrpD
VNRLRDELAPARHELDHHRAVRDRGLVGPAAGRSGVAPDRPVSERLAEYAVSLRFADIPGEVVEHAKDLLLDQIGLAFAGRSTPAGKRAIALAHEMSAGAGTSTLVGERRRVSLLEAVFAHSVLLGYVLDDVAIKTVLHIGRVTHPVAWILGERQHASGRDLITAVVLAYDVAYRLSEPRLGRDYFRMPQTAFAPFAAVAVAARLLQLDLARATDAIAHAAHLGMGLVEGTRIETSGMIARNAVAAAFLAEPGGDGPRAIESPRGLYAAFFRSSPEGLEERLAQLGRDFAIMETSTKRYPGSASHIVPLELTSEFVRESRLSADDVRALKVTLSEDFRGRFDHMESRIDVVDPTDTDIGRSLRLKLAIILARGKIVPVPARADFTDGAVRRALPKVELAFAPGPIDQAGVRIERTDGTVLEREAGFKRYPKVDPSERLRRDGARLLSESKLAELERQLTHLEDVPDVSAVLASTVPD